MTTIPHVSRTRIVIAVAVLAAIALVLVLVPIRIPRDATVYGRMLPAREWVLVRGSGGQLQALLRENGRGTTMRYAVTEPLRGDAMQFVMSSDLQMKSEVDVGDTLGWVLSPELSRELTGLLGAREIAAAALASVRSGDKPAQVELARALLTQARASYDEQRHLHERNSELHARKIISDQEYQQANDRLEVLRCGVDAAEAQLTAALSGQKDDVVREHRETVAALDAEIMALRRRLGSQTFTAPIPGKLSSGSAGDTLLCLRDMETLLVLPVDVEDCARLRRDVPVAFSVPGTGLGGSARILHVRDEVLYLQGRPVCLLIAEITPTSAALRPGLITRADVPCHALPPAEYLSRLWHGLFH